MILEHLLYFIHCISAHTTQFSQPGWMYTKHGMGVSLLEGGGSFVTLQSPDKKDFTIIIETMVIAYVP